MSGSVLTYMFNSWKKSNQFRVDDKENFFTGIERILIGKGINFWQNEFNEKLRDSITKLVGILDRGLEDGRSILFTAVRWRSDADFSNLQIEI